MRNHTKSEQRNHPKVEGKSLPPALYRVWIAKITHWEPKNWGDVPPEAIALEPAEEDAMSAAQAATYLRAFNQAVLRHDPRVWAIALPVALQYEGDPQPGQTVVPTAVRQGPRRRSRTAVGRATRDSRSPQQRLSRGSANHPSALGRASRR